MNDNTTLLCSRFISFNQEKMCRKTYKIVFVLLVLIFLIVCGLIIFLLLQKEASLDTIESSLSPTIRQPVEAAEKATVLGQKDFASKDIQYATPPITGIDDTGEIVDQQFKVI